LLHKFASVYAHKTLRVKSFIKGQRSMIGNI
jgi:hypothetical protein